MAQRLTRYARRDDVLVLALPRGGVPVAFEVAHALEAPLDVYMVRKLSVPGHEQHAIGAIGPGGVRLIHWDSVRRFGIGREALSAAVLKEEQELARREWIYRGNKPRLLVTDCTVILIDDGLSSEATVRVAINALREQQPERIVAAIPISSPAACEGLSHFADEVVCAVTPEDFSSVGAWYDDFSQPAEDDLRTLLDLAAREQAYRDGALFAQHA